MLTFLRFFLFLLPFQFALSPTENIDLPIVRVLAVGIILVWMAKGLFNRQLSLGWNVQTGALLSFWFVLGLSMSVAEEVSWALRKMLFLMSFFPLYFVWREEVGHHQARAFFLVEAFVFGAALSAAIGILQVVLQFFIPVETLFTWWTSHILPFFLGHGFAGAVAEYPSLLVNLSGRTVMRASALFPDPHMHAFYLGLALPLAFFFVWQKRTWLWWSLSLCILIADLLTFSRGAYLGFGLALIGGVFLFGSKLSLGTKKAVLLGIGGVTLLLWVPNPIGERFWSGFSAEDGSVAARLALYQEAGQHIGERPWLGVGIGNYPLAVKPTALPREPIYVHDLWLDIAVETGILGLICFGAFFFSALSSVYRAWKTTGHAFYLALFGSLVLFFGHSLVETPLFSVQVFPAWLFLVALSRLPYANE